MPLSSVLSTGLSSFSNPTTIGPMYPGVGVEWVLVILIFLAWLAWHVYQLRTEGRELKKQAEHFRKIGLDKVLSGGDTHRDTMQ